MCELFIQADRRFWQSTTRSIRVGGVVTSVRLEAFFWSTLTEIADRDGHSIGQLITRLYIEYTQAEHDLGNFTSFLRVCCSRYLSLIADGRLDRDPDTPLSDIDAEPLLKAEAEDVARRGTAGAQRHDPE
ncbi:MAG: ribbon-helix-helix domain-containing protein [Planctomycetota bacterium]